MRKHVHRITFLLLLFISIKSVSQQIITDTIFFNGNWKISEKTLAEYYRIGTLKIDTFWFYTGKFKDYTMKNVLVTEGEYNDEGYKDGMFYYYYPDGKLQASGKYINDKLNGSWKWFYTNGNKRAEIYFPDDEKKFQFISYINEKGEITLENGNGNFVWYTGAIANTGLRVEGSFKDGKRDGGWKYYSQGYTHTNTIVCTEVYDNDQFKKGKMFGLFGDYLRKINSPSMRYNFEPYQMRVIEDMSYDDFFKKNGADKAPMALLNYLLNRKNSEIIIKDSSFENAMGFIISTLDRYRNEIEYKNKDIDGSIEFKLGPSGYPEDISVTGENFNAHEKEFLTFLMNKFTNIEMPGTKTMGIEGYHTIYVYTVNMKEFMPAEVKQYVTGNDIFFSPIKKEQFLTLLRANKKKFKKYVREEYIHFW